MHKITPCLWYDKEAEEAANFYVNIFTSAGRKNCRIGAVARYGDEAAAISGMPKGAVMTVAFQLDGQDFLALNGGPVFKFTEAVSLIVNCETQKEIDALWDKFTEEGQESQCGWLKDKFGLSWQITPEMLERLMADRDPGKSKRVMAALLQMRKIDIRTLEEAAGQK